MFGIGFHNVVVCKPGKTNIINPENLNLYKRIEDSVYVEDIEML